jgi:hypothetical protein
MTGPPSAPVVFLPGYFGKLDAGEDIVDLLAPDFTFSFLWATDDGAQEFAGALDDFLGYMGQRDPAGQRHHISHAVREGPIELVSGWTTRYGSPLGTFLFAVEVTDDGRARRLYAARTEAFKGVPF